MPLPSSGPLSMSAINAEVTGVDSHSLRNLSNAVGFSTPDAMSEFYGYGGLPSGLVAGYNYSSYPGSGTVWNDISGFNRHMTLVNPNWNSVYGYFESGYNTDFQIPGSAALYNQFGPGLNFTWIIRAQWKTNYQDLTGLFWSEDAGKNFLTGMWYPHTGSNFVPRVDSCCTYTASWSSGVPNSNTGPSPSQASFDWTEYCNSPMMIIRKQPGGYPVGDVISFHGMSSYLAPSTPMYLWQTNPYFDWGIGNNNQPIHVMCQSQGSYYAQAYVHSIYMWNRYLSDAECAQVFNYEYPTYYPC
jgi:hypothetical protein